MRILSCEFLDGYSISLHFNNGEQKIRDLKRFFNDFVSKERRQYLDRNIFRKVEINELGNLFWSQGELELLADGIYSGKLYPHFLIPLDYDTIDKMSQDEFEGLNGDVQSQWEQKRFYDAWSKKFPHFELPENR